jgi:DNA-binding transcriptional MerR regulator/methylmalonyl-CoA mutase cobalamin-binding subunit
MYTIRQAAIRSGVNVPLLRAWERRYGIVAPARTDGGYRLYDDAAIDRLRAMRILVDDGMSPRQAADQVTAAAPDDVAAIVGVGASRTEPAGDAASAVMGFVDAAARIDGRGIARAVDELFASGSFERAMEDRIFPALSALGDAWTRGEVDVAGEHAASAAVVRRLSLAFEAAASVSADGDRPILVGLPPGAHHEVAPLACATAARRAGLPVVYLGTDVPVASWVAAVARTGARAIVLGVALDRDVVATDAVVDAVRRDHPTLVIGLGGRMAADVDGDRILRLPDGLLDAVERLRRAVG